MNRAKRRKNKWKKIKKLYDILKTDEHRDKENLKLFSKKHADNYPCCNCSWCKNPRRDKTIKRKNRLTIQERKLYNKYDFKMGLCI